MQVLVDTAVFLKSGALSHSVNCPINSLSIQRIASCQIGITCSLSGPVEWYVGVCSGFFV